MYTQQETIKYNMIYDKYKDSRILFSGNVSKSLGLKQEDTIVKIGMDRTKAALVSATMNDIVVIAKMNELLQRRIYTAKNMVTVHLKFYDSLFKKEMVFNLHTKVLNMNNHGLNHQDMHYVSMKFRRKIPNDLIAVFGKHHEKIQTAAALRNKNVEAMMFVRGIKKVCFPSFIDGDKVLINYLGNPQAFVNHKAMIVIKSEETGDVYEIIGKFDEEFSESNKTFQMKLNYSPEQQSPRFSASMDALVKLVNK